MSNDSDSMGLTGNTMTFQLYAQTTCIRQVYMSTFEYTMGQNIQEKTYQDDIWDKHLPEPSIAVELCVDMGRTAMA